MSLPDQQKDTVKHLEDNASFVEKGDAAGGQVELTPEQIAKERKLVRKLDALILPLTVLLYLSAYLDRGNIGNAKLQGLFTGLLDSSDTKYSIVLLSFYITYILLSIPGTILARAISPSISIASGCLIWATAAACMAGAQNFPSLIVCRLFIGVGESLFGQSTMLYYSYFYRKSEMAKRIAAFIGCGVMAGAFGGLISYGVSLISHPKIDHWRILFLLEGCPSVLLGICVMLFLPNRPSSTSYLTAEERDIAVMRLDRDSLNESAETGVDWAAVRYALCDWKNIILAVCYSGMNCSLGSVSGFLPTIIKDLGYTASKAQLMTVPTYVVALAFMLLLTTLSDRLQSRGIFVSIVFAVDLMGWALLLSLDQAATHARYFAVICVVCGSYGAIPLVISWVSNNNPSQSGRAAGLGMLNSIGQCLAIAASFLFPSAEGPQYTKGISVNLALSCMSILISLFMTTYFRLENARRDKAEGGRPAPDAGLPVTDLYDHAPGYRYVP